ncbi:expressed protein [Chlorella variabilis]|uniref:Expressed protein n=1 Tax=Chlorella variabilis TaxID=554065 RepID=E1ZM07_CHLVA|nr:expressed protein [Chlorella variabilis]EFN53027.1 expressed protein [Chlorella variabilis]|eukprot:XP_005845129.1 expressed protein [Chlorella variabilis]
MCMAEPACQLFVADSLCCLGYGIIQHAAVRMWLVCNADVYLPEPKCLTVYDNLTSQVIPQIDPEDPDTLTAVNVTVIDAPNARSEELLVELPLAYYIVPRGRTPGQLAVQLDMEEARSTYADGLCSLRLREPCEWEGVAYEAVGDVQRVPLLSVLNVGETLEAIDLVDRVLIRGEDLSPPPPPPPSPEGEDGDDDDDDDDDDDTRRRTRRRRRLFSWPWGAAVPAAAPGMYEPAPAPAPWAERRRRLHDAAHLAVTRKLLQDLITMEGAASDPMVVAAQAARGIDITAVRILPRLLAEARSVGGDLPQPDVDEDDLPPLTDTTVPTNFSSIDFFANDWFISWIPGNSSYNDSYTPTAWTEACLMTSAAELPESFLLGNFEELYGYEDDCDPDSLPDVSPTELT